MGPPARRPRTLLGLSALTAALLAAAVVTTPAIAALPGFDWPVQSFGNRGADVRAIQSLLRGHGVTVAYDGIFTTDTRSAVIGFQEARGLPQTGVADAATWEQLVTSVGRGAAREAVLTLQRQLNEKRAAGLVPTGTWDEPTAAAVRAFERHVGLPVDGIADPTAWRYLIAHFDRPAFSSSALCDYSVGNGLANWGTGAAIGQLEAAGRIAVAAGLGRIPVGDVGLEHGGNIAGHQTHELGLEVDVRPVRDRRDQCRWGTNWRLASYDRTATRALIKAIRNAAPGHVKLIFFNDPKLIAEGWSTRFAGHDDHLHIRYCEVEHPVAAYRC
ncbi:MAG: penicillin-insensitive murein endopeptidase [Chloroflexota bacterium]